MNERLHQCPSPGMNLIFREGDFLNITLSVPVDLAGKAYLRTNLYNPYLKRKELIARAEQEVPRRFQEWGDFPMAAEAENSYSIEVPLISIGFFEAKAFFITENHTEPLWPEGNNLYIKVEPALSVISNSIYCAFVRLFVGEDAVSSINENLKSIESIEDKKVSVIPESGKFRDLKKEIDFIVDDLGFDILMLLPVHPVPTTYARMGLLGSPYAALDFMNVDPALAEFDKETTPMEQFSELVDKVHAKHARVFMDIPVNHTGWASQLQVHHPEFFLKDQEGRFVSPGAWGVTWSDLSGLDYSRKDLWEYMAHVFLFWCRKGVDGFRCDAGYMVPEQAWEYITAKVRNEFPSTIFLLEGLGGKVSTTERLLTTCNLNWAYSEMFQNYDQDQMEWYIGEFMRISPAKGPMVNFSETHDNNRLASVSKAFSRLRNGLTALLSDTGTFAITCGVEWYADEKIDVHRLTSLNWGNEDNQVDFLKRLNNILKSHPTFRQAFQLTKMHISHKNSIAYLRHSEHISQKLAVIANLSAEDNEVYLRKELAEPFMTNHQDLLSGEDVVFEESHEAYRVPLKPYQIVALADEEAYFPRVTDLRINRIVTDTKAERMLRVQIMQLFQDYDWVITDEFIKNKTIEFKNAPYDFFSANWDVRPPVIRWVYPQDVNREVVVPEKTPVLIIAPRFFRYTLKQDSSILGHGEGFYLKTEKYVAIIEPGKFHGHGARFQLAFELYDGERVHKNTGQLLLASRDNLWFVKNHFGHQDIEAGTFLNALSVNTRSGISVSEVAFGGIRSKYDALISANLDSKVPEDRHIMLTRIRGWSVYKGFSRAIMSEYQTSFYHSENLAEYRFEIPAGAGLVVPLALTYRFDEADNLLDVSLKRTEGKDALVLPQEEAVKIILRPDIESRNHHELTKAFQGPEDTWPVNIREGENGFTFHDQEKMLNLVCRNGEFVREDEWHYRIPYPMEMERGMDGEGDLYSPGYFKILLKGNETVHLSALVAAGEEDSVRQRRKEQDLAGPDKMKDEASGVKEILKNSVRKFIVDRNSNKTVIAGHPWFLDWGRDTLICLRGIISAGYTEEAKSIIREFASFEKDGTLPNVIRGKDTSNRDTSDAPLWLFAGVQDLLSNEDTGFLQEDCGGRTLLEVLRSIAVNYMEGTPNGIQMDHDSGLIYSPTHFTWMDTNYPAGTPREGYPIEIQALWYHAVHFLSGQLPDENRWTDLAGKIKESIKTYFLIEKQNHCTVFEKEIYLSDCLHTSGFEPASQAVRDDHLRPNQLFAITLGAVEEKKIGEGILLACEELVVPGAIRTLADRNTEYQLPVYHNGQLLNDPFHPYKGRYEGEEDHSRKPAYHNGTAWTWTFPSYCEAMYKTYGENGLKASRDILFTSMRQMNQGCIAQLPEILDGDFPHMQRGCYAQAWGITEFYRLADILGLI
ncbi:MAG: glycogen debranching enzyme N-terminal domain-containing protein [Bacteroidales bacterium]|nr:glycogen debranching enzyme N-terminal domain-containing protein [Bacteroidales bacterium]